MKKILVCVASAVVMLTGLAAPAHAAKRPKTYSCQAIQGDVIVSSVGFITKKQANTFKKQFPAPDYKTTCVKNNV